jgi:hypothetical protein
MQHIHIRTLDSGSAHSSGSQREYEYRIFPAAQLLELKPGTAVYVNLRSDKETGLARVLRSLDSSEAPVQTSDETTTCVIQTPKKQLNGGYCRVAVLYAEGGTANVRLGRITPVRRQPCCIAACELPLNLTHP